NGEFRNLSKAFNKMSGEIYRTFEILQQEIGERKNIEENLAASLKEKEILIKELYHRTKNNMQIINSMLALHSRKENNQIVKNIITDMSSRINAMSLVHQKLYESHNLSNINFKEYIIELCGLLLKSYVKSPQKVEIIYDIEDVNIIIDVALPCGLVITELITNSLKYAFPDNKDGKIIVNIYKIQHNVINIEVSDNGVGLKKDFNFEKDIGMGLKTVESIVNSQLDGEVSFLTNSGLSVIIKAKIDLYNERV
ncbi:MAG TPA: histidine kinase dimerization/phosphoacceptor domain -containing protein, partial [Spirochaetota bacterium]|nr:histidine kinase dimerization/phosphoacceptor domain -containing protein [Spirochaetota bacterium]